MYFWSHQDCPHYLVDLSYFQPLIEHKFAVVLLIARQLVSVSVHILKHVSCYVFRERRTTPVSVFDRERERERETNHLEAPIICCNTFSP